MNDGSYNKIMASNYPSPPASPRRLDDLLICPVCLEGFKEPRTLSCLHTFCTGCLEHCRRAYRRDISCPVCKKVTHLPALGVHGLQSDFRVQQIRDILINQGPEQGSNIDGKEADSNNKVCDLCKTQQKQSPACHHCIQCFMYFCEPCHNKHNSNPLFSSHHVINMGESNATEVLFCRVHSDHPVRYFCKPCSVMLCTICTMNHEPSHAPEPLEKGIITKYRKELEVSLRTIKSKLSEVKTKTKYLETIKQTHQKALYKAQIAIKEKTDGLVLRIREQESKLLQEVQNKIDAQMKETGIDTLGEIKFYRTNIETLYTEIENVIQGSPQQCLVAYEDLIARMKSIPETPLIGSSPSTKESSIVKFIPAMDSNIDVIIGTLQECSLEADSDGEEQTTSMDSLGSHHTSSPKLRKRTASILSALSPGRKTEVKMGKIKGVSSSHELSGSPRSKINADEALRKAGASTRDRSPNRAPAASANFAKSPSSPSALVKPRSPSPVSFGNSNQNSCKLPSKASSSPVATTSQVTSKNTVTKTEPSSARSDASGNSDITNVIMLPSTPLSAKFRLVFKVDQVGQWPGKITQPSGIAFLPEGTLIVAECENRLQVFDRNGHSVRVIGWGKVQPQRVTTMQNGKIAVTDKKDKCIKIYSAEGDLVGSWGAGMFEMPTGT